MRLGVRADSRSPIDADVTIAQSTGVPACFVRDQRRRPWPSPHTGGPGAIAVTPRCVAVAWSAREQRRLWIASSQGRQWRWQRWRDGFDRHAGTRTRPGQPVSVGMARPSR